jgi:hypothetical protein
MIASHAISAFNPYGVKEGDGVAPTYWMARWTSAHISAQPTRTDNPTSGGLGVDRQVAARAANFRIDATLDDPFPGVGTATDTDVVCIHDCRRERDRASRCDEVI